MNRISRNLLKRGSPGDRVAILSSNRFEAYEIYLAAMNAGMAATPLNPRLHADEHAFMIADSEAHFVVFSEDYREHLGRVRNSLSTVAHWVCIGEPDQLALPYEDLLSGDIDAAPDIQIAPDSLAWLFYTSGTTGKPKGAMETQRNLVSMVQQFLIDIVPDAAPTDVMLHAAPIAHGTASMGLPHIAVGAAQCFPLTRTFEPAKIFELIERLRVTSTFLAPTMIQTLLRSPDRARHDLSSLKNIVYGGGPMHVQILEEALETFGPIFVQIYGQGEAPMACSTLSKGQHVTNGNPMRVKRLASAGRETTGVIVRIADDEGHHLMAGETGEIVVRSDLVMKGYWKRPEATAEALNSGWLRTGDVGHIDEDGYLYITDRKKDLIISGGSNIYPREVEEVIIRHPSVSEVCVFGVPDETWGEAVKAAIVLKSGCEFRADEIIEFCRDRLASYKKPKSIEVLNELPKNANGKVLRREIRDRYWIGRDRRI